MIALPFVEHAKTDNIRTDIIADPYEFLFQKLNGSKFDFGVQNIITTGHYKEMGYSYSFRVYLYKFLYKQYGQWHEIYALNKTNARKLIDGKIESKIINIEHET